MPDEPVSVFDTQIRELQSAVNYSNSLLRGCADDSERARSRMDQIGVLSKILAKQYTALEQLLKEQGDD